MFIFVFFLPAATSRGFRECGTGGHTDNTGMREDEFRAERQIQKQNATERSLEFKERVQNRTCNRRFFARV